MGALDIVTIPDYPGMWARRVVVEAWVAAGSPPLDGAGRTYEQQKWFYERWKAGVGNAADNPDAPTRQPHVRGMALDLRVWNADVVRRMRAAGFVRPITIRRGTPWPDGRGGFSQDEGWHFELEEYVDRIYSIPKVTASTAGQATPFKPSAPEPPADEEEDDMPKNTGIYTQRKSDQKWVYLVFNYGSGIGHEFGSGSSNPMPADYNNALAVSFDTPSWAKVTEGHYYVVKASLEKVLKIEIPGSVELSGTVDFE